jgi:hypothetical protein
MIRACSTQEKIKSLKVSFIKKCGEITEFEAKDYRRRQNKKPR